MTLSALPRSIFPLGILLLAACSSSPAAPPPPGEDVGLSTHQDLAKDAGTKLARSLKALSEAWPETVARDAEQRAYLRVSLDGEHAGELAETLAKGLGDSPVTLTADPAVKGLVLLGGVVVEGVEHSLNLQLVDPQRARLMFVTREVRLVMSDPGPGEEPLKRPNPLLDDTARGLVQKLGRVNARGWPRTVVLSPASGRPVLIWKLEHSGLQNRVLVALFESQLVDLQLSGPEAEALGASPHFPPGLALRGSFSELDGRSSCSLSIYDVEAKRVLVRNEQVQRTASPR